MCSQWGGAACFAHTPAWAVGRFGGCGGGGRQAVVGSFGTRQGTLFSARLGGFACHMVLPRAVALASLTPVMTHGKKGRPRGRVNGDGGNSWWEERT